MQLGGVTERDRSNRNHVPTWRRHDSLLLLSLLRGATSANTILCDTQPSSWVTSCDDAVVVVVVVCDTEHTQSRVENRSYVVTRSVYTERI